MYEKRWGGTILLGFFDWQAGMGDMSSEQEGVARSMNFGREVVGPGPAEGPRAENRLIRDGRALVSHSNEL